ncbi:hypothetical protein G6011_07866 [Alternaria panax]|uniref:DNA (cytosine-5-)-methyltransferase n=1 Tax=Alternaria panax TaxID=48097 RepID=A0AAD4I4T3_9PLEO|nr:hypothetical protein G6011_07866 [Alternaria panax]
MSDRRYDALDDDAVEYGDDLYEIALIDLTDEEGYDASGPIDIDKKSAELANAHVQSRAPTTDRLRARNSTTPSADVQLETCRLPDGTVIKVGDAVELRKPSFREQGLQSGDFLKVSKIVKNAVNEEVSLSGHRFVREKYLLGRGSNGKSARLNEVMMHLEAREDDNRPAIVQGLVKIPLEEVKRKRDIMLTTKPYPMLSFRDQPAAMYQRMRPKEEIKRDIFERGQLFCRWSRTTILSPNGMAYGGIMRLLSKRETTRPDRHKPRSQDVRGLAASHDQRLRKTLPVKRLARTPSLEVLNNPPAKRGNAPPVKKEEYTYVDVCCGAGGSSRGAVQAGLKIIAGLDFDELAMDAWIANNPGGLPFCMDAFDFLAQELFKIIGRVHILSISISCKVFSSAHTVEGRDDEMNVKALDLILPMLENLKPRILVLENTASLVNMKKNQAHFNRLLRNITSAQPGYSVSYKVVNMVDYGLPQPRKRLIIIAARRGVPLPPFPKPTHGSANSGLQPYVSIGDALEKMERLGQRASNDPYHQPDKMKVYNSEPYDAYSKFINCIMTSGVMSLHPNGKRNFTPRELAILQSLPHNHHLTGTDGKAIKQVGNMFPPVMAEIVYRSCAQTLEAFDHGFITAEDEIEDLDITLIEKGVIIPEPRAQSIPPFSSTFSSKETQYTHRYLRPPQLSDATHAAHSSAWQKRELTGRVAPQRRNKRAPSSVVADGDYDDDEANYATPSPTSVREQKHTVPGKSRREKQFWEKFNGKTIDLSIESDEESDTLFV